MGKNDLPLVTIIIPTYNRFDCLLNALDSAKNQTYINTEIIVVNDRSTQEEYYNYDYPGCIVVHLDKNSKARFGHASPGGYQRNVGMKLGTGVYYAFLDDDDYWMPDKIEKQVAPQAAQSGVLALREEFLVLRQAWRQVDGRSPPPGPEN